MHSLAQWRHIERSSRESRLLQEFPFKESDERAITIVPHCLSEDASPRIDAAGPKREGESDHSDSAE